MEVRNVDFNDRGTVARLVLLASSGLAVSVGAASLARKLAEEATQGSVEEVVGKLDEILLLVSEGLELRPGEGRGDRLSRFLKDGE